MKKYLLLYLMFTFILIQKVISQGTIIGTNMDGDLSTSVSDPPEFDPLCHIHTIALTIPAATDSIYQVTNALINYTMISSNEGMAVRQKSKMFFENTSIEEEEWTEGVDDDNGIVMYSRNINIANGLYSSGDVLTFGMWAVRSQDGGILDCSPDSTWVVDGSWTIEIQYSTIAIDTGAVGIGTLSPEPSSILDIKSQQRGFLPPRMSELFLQFIPNPAEGLMAYCTDCDPVGLYCMKGGIWVTIGSGGSDIFTKTGNNIHQKSTDFNESFLIGRNALPDNSLINETFMFFDHPKAAFRGGLLTNESKPWQPDSLGVGSFAYGENLYAPSFGEIALGINNEPYTPISADTFHSTDRVFSIGIGTGVVSNQGGKFKNAITVLKNGNVGIGDATPDATLDVLGSLIVQRKLTSGLASEGIISVKGSNLDLTTVLIESPLNSGKISLFNNIDIKAIEIDAKVPGIFTGPAIELFNYFGTSTILLEGGSGASKGKITTGIIEIQGGSDFAEYFDINYGDDKNEIIPGLVVSIDENNEGELKLSQQKHDRKVIGVISGANGVDAGMVMGQKGSIAFGDHAVSLIGRVYVKCNNENGAIKAGDFLTTSSTSGEAMRVKKFRKSRGAILGKALSGIDPVSGFVLVFVNLQ